MTREQEEAARLLSELRDRVANLEQRERAEGAPSLIRTVDDVGADADVVQTTVRDIVPAMWNETGYRTSGWNSYDRS